MLAVFGTLSILALGVLLNLSTDLTQVIGGQSEKFLVFEGKSSDVFGPFTPKLNNKHPVNSGVWFEQPVRALGRGSRREGAVYHTEPATR